MLEIPKRSVTNTGYYEAPLTGITNPHTKMHSIYKSTNNQKICTKEKQFCSIYIKKKAKNIFGHINLRIFLKLIKEVLL